MQAMPRPGQHLDTGRTESEDMEEAVALSLQGDFATAAPPQDGISFAHMTRMGYAASGNLLVPSLLDLERSFVSMRSIAAF